MDEQALRQIVLKKFMDEEEEQQKREKMEHKQREEEEMELRGARKKRLCKLVDERAVTELLSDLDLIKNLKHPDESSSDRKQVGRGGSTPGFYKVPEDMRLRAGSEAAALYDAKYVNFGKIKELFEKDYQGDVQTRNQLLRHYHYHLRSFAEMRGRGDDIEGLIQKLGKDLQITVPVDENYIIGVSEPCSHDHLLGSPVICAHIFLSDLFIRS